MILLLGGFFASLACAGEPVRVSGTGSGTGGMHLVARAYMKANPGATVTVLPALGSAGGISALLAGRLDVAVANRTANDRERSSTLNSREYAITPFVLATARRTGVTEISSAQLAQMYQDPAATWPNMQRARPILRLADATDTTLIKSIGPAVARGVDDAAVRRGMLSATTDSETADLLEKTPGSFGPSTLAQILSEDRAIVPLVIDGKYATVEALAAGTYPLAKPLFVIHRKDANAATLAFLAYLQGPEAKRLLAAHGHLVR